MTTDLMSRLEALTGPSREVDAEYTLVIHPYLKDCPRDDREDGPGWMTKDGRTYAPRYTESLDAALSLVPDGASWEIGTYVTTGKYRAYALTDQQGNSGHGATPAIALLIAILRARETEEK